MPEPVQHSDFGEKIGGAKKDLWQQRGLVSSDLSEMNDREAEKYIKKDNVWKKNDYQAMIEGGIPFDVVYFIKKVRDSLNAKPVFLRLDDTEAKRLERQEQYIDTVRELESVMLSVRTKDDALTACKKFFLDNGYLEISQSYYGNRYSTTEKGQQNTVITNKLFQALNKTATRFDYDITKKAIKEQFGVLKEDKIPRGFDIRFNDGKNTYSKENDWQLDTWYAVKGYSIIKTNFESKEDALKWLQDYASHQSSDRKKRFIPPQLENVKRDGPDYRQDQDINGQNYLDTFDFKGGEFGNWMNQNDRQASLNLGYEALKDLADALQISDRDISYNGALSIAFGARGSGNAVAHYEPLRKVINLTKMRGAGSLAHEWWHGLDDYLGAKLGVKGFLSDHAHKLPSFNKLMDAIKYKSETPEQAAERTVKQNERMQKNADGWLKSVISDQLQKDEKALPEYEKLRQGFLRGEAGNIAKINELQKSITGRVIPKENRERLENFERWLGQIDSTPPTIGRVSTDYLRNSKEMGGIFEKEGGYWDSNVELTARAFATYVMDKLGQRSDYLIGHAECAINIVADKAGELQILKAYPQGEERKAINQVFDNLVAELKLQNYLTHDDRVIPNLQTVLAAETNLSGNFKHEKTAVSDQLSLFNDIFYSAQNNGYDEDEEDLEV